MRDTAVALTAAGIDNTRFEARLLVARAADASIEHLVAHGRSIASPETASRLRALTARRVQREPMAHILGEREFWGLTFEVSQDVLVPRPDSETLIEAALAGVPGRDRAIRILDLGVGSGCLLLTLLREFPNAHGVGLDASDAALAVARRNARRLGVMDRASLVLGDWTRPGWTDGIGGPFDLVVSNPPYIEAGLIDGLMPEVARFEPRLALDGGPDGLAAYRILAAAARNLVTADGLLLLEAGEGQAVEISALLAAEGFRVRAPKKDLAGIDRIVIAEH